MESLITSTTCLKDSNVTSYDSRQIFFKNNCKPKIVRSLRKRQRAGKWYTKTHWREENRRSEIVYQSSFTTRATTRASKSLLISKANHQNTRSVIRFLRIPDQQLLKEVRKVKNIYIQRYERWPSPLSHRTVHSRTSQDDKRLGPKSTIKASHTTVQQSLQGRTKIFTSWGLRFKVSLVVEDTVSTWLESRGTGIRIWV